MAGKPPKAYLNYVAEQVYQATSAITDAAGSHRSPAQTAIQWVLQNTAITSAIVGVRTMEQLKHAAQTPHSAAAYRK